MSLFACIICSLSVGGDACGTSSPERLFGFLQHLLPRQAEIAEHMRVVGKLAQCLSIELPLPQANPSGPWIMDRAAQAFLMKLRSVRRQPLDQG